MKWGLEMREHHVLETHLNLMTDFTGSRERISATTSFGRVSDIVLFLGIEEDKEENILEGKKLSESVAEPLKTFFVFFFLEKDEEKKTT
jgi:hypothetical protein